MTWIVIYRQKDGTVKTSPPFLKKNSAEIWLLYLKFRNEIVEGWIEESSELLN